MSPNTDLAKQDHRSGGLIYRGTFCKIEQDKLFSPFIMDQGFLVEKLKTALICFKKSLAAFHCGQPWSHENHWCQIHNLNAEVSLETGKWQIPPPTSQVNATYYFDKLHRFSQFPGEVCPSDPRMEK